MNCRLNAAWAPVMLALLAGCGAGSGGNHPLTVHQGTAGTGGAQPDGAAPDAPSPGAVGTSGQAGGGPAGIGGGAAGTGGGAAGTGGLATYELDLTSLYPTTFAAQEFAAFSIDLTTRDKKITRLDWDTVAHWPSGADCAGLPQDVEHVSDSSRGDSAIALTSPNDKLKGFHSPYHVHLRQVEFDVTRRGVGYEGDVVEACLVVRAGQKGEWTWRTRKFVLTRQVRDSRFAATVDLDVPDVDAVGILFDTSQTVDRIRYTIEPAAGGPGGPSVAVQEAACCDACKDATSGVASGYCCTQNPPQLEPCTEEDLPVAPKCVPHRDLYDAAAAACRAKGTWLRDVSTRDAANECPPESQTILESGLSRRAHFKCCRDSYFVPQPPDSATPVPDCQLVGGSWSPCASHEEMLEGAVQTCYRNGLVHRSISFQDRCAPGAAGTSMTMSVCCRPGVAGPPANSCSR